MTNLIGQSYQEVVYEVARSQSHQLSLAGGVHPDWVLNSFRYTDCHQHSGSGLHMSAADFADWLQELKFARLFPTFSVTIVHSK